jgi:hypothetical protein
VANEDELASAKVLIVFVSGVSIADQDRHHDISMWMSTSVTISHITARIMPNLRHGLVKDFDEELIPAFIVRLSKDHLNEFAHVNSTEHMKNLFKSHQMPYNEVQVFDDLRGLFEKFGTGGEHISLILLPSIGKARPQSRSVHTPSLRAALPGIAPSPGRISYETMGVSESVAAHTIHTGFTKAFELLSSQGIESFLPRAFGIEFHLRTPTNPSRVLDDKELLDWVTDNHCPGGVVLHIVS